METCCGEQPRTCSIFKRHVGSASRTFIGGRKFHVCSFKKTKGLLFQRSNDDGDCIYTGNRRWSMKPRIGKWLKSQQKAEKQRILGEYKDYLNTSTFQNVLNLYNRLVHPIWLESDYQQLQIHKILDSLEIDVLSSNPACEILFMSKTRRDISRVGRRERKGFSWVWWLIVSWFCGDVWD